MVDDDVMNHIRKTNIDKASPIVREIAMMIGTSTEEVASLVGKAYETHEEFGNSITANVLIGAILVNSKNIDQALERIDKIYEEARKGLETLDKEVNMK